MHLERSMYLCGAVVRRVGHQPEFREENQHGYESEVLVHVPRTPQSIQHAVQVEREHEKDVECVVGEGHGADVVVALQRPGQVEPQGAVLPQQILLRGCILAVTENGFLVHFELGIIP
jgi:hypothetical protein